MLIKINEGKNKKQDKDDIVLYRIPRKAPLIKGFTKFLRDHFMFACLSPMNPTAQEA